MKKTTQKLRYLEKKCKYFSKINKNALSGEEKNSEKLHFPPGKTRALLKQGVFL